MIFMADTSEDLTVVEAEIGLPVEQLQTPLTNFNSQRPDDHFAIDNGCYRGFDRDKFRRLLDKHYSRRHLCRWVALPDVVASARRTLEAFEHWQHIVPGWKKALVAQDGIENLPIPWGSLDAIFIGGSTEWKLSRHAADVIRTAKICGKWVHVGRVNTPGRMEYFEDIGADSTDGSGLSRYTWMRQRIYDAATKPTLFSHAERATCFA